MPLEFGLENLALVLVRAKSEQTSARMTENEAFPHSVRPASAKLRGRPTRQQETGVDLLL